MISPSQLREFVIKPVLYHLAPEIPFSMDAADLLLGTAAQESNCCFYLHQVDGPAVGGWQMEPNTANDHLRAIAASPALNAKILDLAAPRPGIVVQMAGNLNLACAMARLHYWRAPGPIPSTAAGQAGYWKQYYNTPAGAGTVDQYLSNWSKVR